MKATTKGDIVLEDIKVGDIHYEYEYGMCIKSRVITQPTRTEDGYWSWKSVHIKPDGTEGGEIDYRVSETMNHYGPNLYNTEAYTGYKII